ncbi:MAG: hypothetical protein H0V73_02270 [Chloroflexi bacterium]|nr:hypothetical protein [Chloroflexota bacterium]
MTSPARRMTSPARRIEIVAAGFADPAKASATAEELRRVLDVSDGDIAIHEVAGDEEFIDGAAVALAGRIREFRLADVKNTIRRHGGVILTEVPERWALPWQARATEGDRRHAEAGGRIDEKRSGLRAPEPHA